jgi:hypothetical protein
MNWNPAFGTKDDQELVEFGDTVLRLDRSYIGLDNFGFAVISAVTNEILEVGDSYHFLNSKR